MRRSVQLKGILKAHPVQLMKEDFNDDDDDDFKDFNVFLE